MFHERVLLRGIKVGTRMRAVRTDTAAAAAAAAGIVAAEVATATHRTLCRQTEHPEIPNATANKHRR